jgi:hypothetical protein
MCVCVCVRAPRAATMVATLCFVQAEPVRSHSRFSRSRNSDDAELDGAEDEVRMRLRLPAQQRACVACLVS